MGNIKTPNSGLRGRYSAGGSIGRPRSTNGYNHSALALEFPDISFPNDRPQPVLLSNPAGRAANAPMFSGLDPGRRRIVVPAFLHSCSIFLSLLHCCGGQPMAQTMVVQPPDTAVVVIPFTLYDPPPPPVMTVAKVQGGGGGGAHRLVAPSRRTPACDRKSSPHHPAGSCENRGSEVAG